MKKEDKLRIIIAGSRKLEGYELFEKMCVDIISKEQYEREIDNKRLEIVSGNNAMGADYYGELLSKKYLQREATLFPADWNDMNPPVIIGNNFYGEYNKLAGTNRNQKMAKYVLDGGAGILIAFDAEESKPRTGTKDMIKIAKKAKIKTYHIKCENKNNIRIKIYNEKF